ncbi:MAG TPA: GH116 family glycosyl-hydrolase [Phycisphaerae bacterium]|nr:GH116 family glycosyl-hydrolase [Phycisphaerae bacterium]
MTRMLRPDWPVLRSYDRDHLGRIAMPLGGIGTGTVSLGGRGDLRDWEVVNRPAKGFTPAGSFFALWAKAAGRPGVTRCIEGAIPPEQYEGDRGCVAPNHGLPRFRECSFAAAYPLGQVLLRDRDVPLDVRIEAFNPLVPADADDSGIPVAVLRFVLVNRTSRPVAASVCGSLLNLIGADGSGAPLGWAGDADPRAMMKDNHNEFRAAKGLAGVHLFTKRPDTLAEPWGTMALATTQTRGVTHRTAWAAASWGGALLDFWEDFSADGRLEERTHEGEGPPTASLAASVRVPPRGSREVTFLLCWHFPNRYTWTPQRKPKGDSACCPADDRIGNYYATQYADAWDVAVRTAGRLGTLERRTVAFGRAFCGSDLPAEVKEAALFNLSTLRTQTCFRTPDGHLFGWEGCCDGRGCCHGSCTHVWNYEQATAFLFGDLAAGMREVEFLHATDARTGHMAFRTGLPLDRARQWPMAAADGQMGCLMKLYRDWQLSGDGEMLRRLWPAARKAMEFCWIDGGWDADRDGVMEGCQHNTMDVEYYGPNPQMGLWYLGALRACEEMARHLGEDDFAATCRGLFERGRRWLDEHLFNGEYYEHEVRPPAGPDAIAPGLRTHMGAKDLAAPELQLGPGCLVDQLVGQFMAHVCGLGHLVRPDHVRKTLASICRHNLRRGFFEHFNHNRSFVMNDEAGLLMATYPRGRRPTQPFPYETEVMTGFEYAAAVGMLQEGMIDRGLECIRAIRDRYDGRKRNPFDEAECGHHYARAMASWAAVLTLTGFRFSGVEGAMEFAATAGPGRFFWSTGRAWGTFTQRPTRRGVRAELTVLHGTLHLRRLTLAGAGTVEFPRPRAVGAGRSVRVVV